jgi:hypothetical protein
MSSKTYACSVLRYIHDPMTGEFVNVGLVLTIGDRAYADGIFRNHTQRITQFFPGVKSSHLRRTLGALKTATKQSKKLFQQSLIESEEDGSGPDYECKRVMQFARGILIEDDSALQWSEPFTGVTTAPAETLKRLYDRLVVRYDIKKGHQQRSDDQVWRVFSKELEARDLMERLQEHVVESKLERVPFKHALKNGKWHLLEPVSFDLLSPESITDKAKRILGQMTLLSHAGSDLKLHFLVGEPSDASVRDAYETAMNILGEVPISKKIYSDSKVDEFVAEINKIAASVQIFRT